MEVLEDTRVEPENGANLFRCQRYYFRWLCGLPCVLLGFAGAWLLRNITDSLLLFGVFCAMCMVIVLSLYYALTNRMTWFLSTGSYRLEEGDIFLSVYGKEYRLHDVEELFATEISYFLHRCAKVTVETEGEVIAIFSVPLREDEDFEESSLYPLFQAILASRDDLEPVCILDTEMENWYKKKK